MVRSLYASVWSNQVYHAWKKRVGCARMEMRIEHFYLFCNEHSTVQIWSGLQVGCSENARRYHCQQCQTVPLPAMSDSTPALYNDPASLCLLGTLAWYHVSIRIWITPCRCLSCSSNAFTYKYSRICKPWRLFAHVLHIFFSRCCTDFESITDLTVWNLISFGWYFLWFYYNLTCSSSINLILPLWDFI